MATNIRFRLFLTSFLILGGIVAAVNFGWANGWVVETVLCILGAGLVTTIFSRSLAWRIERLKEFADRLLEAENEEAPLPDEGEDTSALNQSLRRMASRIRDLVESLRQESAKRDLILGSMVEGVLAVDYNQRVLFCNQAVNRIFGLTQPVMAGAPAIGLSREPRFLGLIAEVLSVGAPVTTKLELSGEESSVFEVYAVPLEMTPSRGALVILHDITGLERLERIRKDFVANVSHELRTPLTAIRGYAETLLDGAMEDTENNRRFVEIIQSHAIRLNNIASDLLVLSDLESGRKDTPAGAVSVDEVVTTALLTVEAEARLRGVTLVREGLAGQVVTGHSLRLEQVLVNLLDNAVKFNRQGGEARIEIGTTAEGHVTIGVSDTGSGIPSDDLPRIFERFYRVDRARSREVGGTGLGLSIVKHVVERMEGSIRVESRLGRGSKFTIVLPPGFVIRG